MARPCGWWSRWPTRRRISAGALTQITADAHEQSLRATATGTLRAARLVATRGDSWRLVATHAGSRRYPAIKDLRDGVPTRRTSGVLAFDVRQSALLGAALGVVVSLRRSLVGICPSAALSGARLFSAASSATSAARLCASGGRSVRPGRAGVRLRVVPRRLLRGARRGGRSSSVGGSPAYRRARRSANSAARMRASLALALHSGNVHPRVVQAFRPRPRRGPSGA